MAGDPSRHPSDPRMNGTKPRAGFCFSTTLTRGGEIWFPTRKIAVNPKAGCLIRFPTGIPFGRTGVSNGYQFTLEGENTPFRQDEENWGNVTIY